ncbi:hypothetical protein GCM10023318_51510 [Nocardia callitridis]|uniref:Uncharacterized protein n=1 Tax=Nocardia callitridis TaxID=648753 RepID=A0ABP9KSC6_9NOCA
MTDALAARKPFEIHVIDRPDTSGHPRDTRSCPARARQSPPEPARARQSPPEPARARQSPPEPARARQDSGFRAHDVMKPPVPQCNRPSDVGSAADQVA